MWSQGPIERDRTWRPSSSEQTLWGWAASLSSGYWKNLPAIGRITSIQLLLTQSVASVSSNCFLFFFSIFKHCLQSPLVNSFSLSRRNLSCVCPILYPSLLFPAHFFISKMHQQERRPLASLCNLKRITWHGWICFIICKVDNNTCPPSSDGGFETQMR